jgi:hypothetical protein
LTGEGQGEGEKSRNFKKLFITLPIIPSRQGRGNFTFYDFIKFKFLRISLESLNPPPRRTGLNPNVPANSFGEDPKILN